MRSYFEMPSYEQILAEVHMTSNTSQEGIAVLLFVTVFFVEYLVRRM